MRERLLLGDEAVAQAAIDAGIAGAFSYPGTPATEVFEYIQHGPGAAEQVSARWSANQKVACEEALGMSYAGRRAVVSMKHVALNEPLVRALRLGGIPVFPSADQAIRSLGRYLCYRAAR